jgi:hypothetical protein
MSILNDALKKAARDRRTHQAAAPTTPTAAPTPPERLARPPRESFTVGIAVGAVLVALGAGGILAWYTGPQVPEPAPPPRTEQPAPQEAAPLPGITLPLDTAATPATPLTADTAAPAAPPTDAPAPPSPAPEPEVVLRAPEPPPGPTPAELEDLALRARLYLDAITIAGARGTGPDGRALINNRLHRVGDTVDPVLNLRLVDVAPGRLTFEDPHGRRYTRSF